MQSSKRNPGFVWISSVLLACCIFFLFFMRTSIAVTFTFVPGSPEAAEYADAASVFWTPGDYYDPSSDHLQHKLPFVVHPHTVYFDDPIFPAITQYGVCCIGIGTDAWNNSHTYVKSTAMWSQRVNRESPRYEYWYAAGFFPLPRTRIPFKSKTPLSIQPRPS
jgi:hypothetical protein